MKRIKYWFFPLFYLLSTFILYVTRFRRSFYEYGLLKKEYFRVPIISVGNLTLGGTGKTPMIIWLCEFLEKNGLVPLVLTRGYKGRLEHSSGHIQGGQKFRSNPLEFGDEPLLISKKMRMGSVVVGKNRSQNLKKYFPLIMPDVVCLDDGFQHLKLYRSLNIVLFDAMVPLESYQVAPLGILRESPSALKDADVIIITRSNQVTEEKLHALYQFLERFTPRHALMARAIYQPTYLLNAFDHVAMDLENLKGLSVIALTALASPSSFYDMLKSLGAQIVDRFIFPDHYYFDHEDVNEVLFKATQLNAMIITTEKDMIKLKKVTKDERILALSVELTLTSGKEDFIVLLKKVLKRDLRE